jgi:DNA adenine methylase
MTSIPASLGRRAFIINVATVPTPSPLRYPGGKSWLVPYVRQWLAALPPPIHFAEPFAGGANVGLTVALEELAEHVTLVELDRDVAAVWATILSGPVDVLAHRITEFRMSKRAVLALLKSRPRTQLDRGFLTLVKNRVRRGGILSGSASLLKLGENGNGLKSRWYPATLKRRIEAISAKSSKITFLCEDGFKFIHAHRKDEGCAFFIDPPYTVAGERLYHHSEIDHRALFEVSSQIAGSVLMTYDNTRDIRKLVKEFGFQSRRVQMQTSHHSVKTELLISREFSWLNRRKLT